MRNLLRITAEVSAAWHRFWFTPSDPMPLGLIRLVVGAMLFYTHAIWSLDLLGFFGASGWNNAGVLNSLQQDTFSWSLWWWIPPGAEYPFHVTCLIVLFLFWIGFASRFTSVLAWIITVSYAHRSMLANFGLDQINAMLAFYLMLGPCGARLSVDSWWRRRKRISVAPSAAATLATRLIQVHICVIYVWAGLSKLQGSAWWTGDAVWYVIANYEYQSLDLTWLANYPAVLQLATHGVLLFEITFPFLVFHRRLRPLALVVGVFIHLGIGAFLGMWTFGLIMICGYVAFLDPETIRWGSASVVRGVRRSSEPSESSPTSPSREASAQTSPQPMKIASENKHLASNETQPSVKSLPALAAADPMVPENKPELVESASTVKIAKHFPEHGESTSSPNRRRRYVTDKLLYVARSRQQRANVRAYFQRHAMACSVLRGAADLIEKTVNLRKATIVLRAKDFSPAELQFWFDELVETNPEGQFRIFLLPDTKHRNSTESLEVPPQIRLFRLSATTTLRRIRKLYVNQDWDRIPASDEAASEHTHTKSIRAAKLMSWLLLMVVLAGCGAKQNTPKVQLERARMLLERGQLHEAVQAFTAALSAANGNADDYYDRGVAYEQLGQLEQAAADYTEALRLAPMHAQALNNRAVVFAQLDRVEEALLDLSQAIEINPHDALAWSNRGLARHESGAFAESIADYTQALQLSKEARLYFQRGNVLVDFKKPEQAVEDFTAALGLDESFVRAYLNRANAFVQLGRMDEAISDLQTASQMDTELSMAGAVQQLERQIRGEKWRETAAAGLKQWLETQRYEIMPSTEARLSQFLLVHEDDEQEAGMPCLIAPTGPHGSPVFDANLSQKLVEHDGHVALLVVDQQELIRGTQLTSSEQPVWLKDWRFKWKPLPSDFIPSQVEVLLGPPAD